MDMDTTAVEAPKTRKEAQGNEGKSKRLDGMAKAGGDAGGEEGTCTHALLGETSEISRRQGRGV